MSTSALVGMNNIVGKPIEFPKNPLIIASDAPSTGGISGTLGKFDKPHPGALEERPKVYDPQKGDWVYADELLQNVPWIKSGAMFNAKPHICYTA